MKKHDVAKKMKKEYTGHYQLDTMGRTRSLSSKAVAKAEKRYQKGKSSLNSTGKNEGENMMLGKNNTQRS